MTSASPLAGVIAEFIGHPREPSWHRAYVDARNSVQDARSVTIYDVADVSQRVRGTPEGRVTILVRVLRSRDVSRKTVRDEVHDDCRRQVQDGHLTIGISPFGPKADDAADALFKHLGQPPSGLARWISGTETLDGLRDLLAEWLLIVVDRRLPGMPPAGLVPNSEAVLAEEMPSTVAATTTTGPRRLRGMP
jgi:hypothetical protein